MGVTNADNQLPGSTYDGDGSPVGYKGTALTFDPEGRLTQYGGAEACGWTGDGLRAWKDAGGLTYFLYDGDQPVCELNSSGVVVAVHTFGPNGLLARGFGSSGGTSTAFYTWDLSGNLARRLDSNGNMLTSALFDGFGRGQVRIRAGNRSAAPVVGGAGIRPTFRWAAMAFNNAITA